MKEIFDEETLILIEESEKRKIKHEEEFKIAFEKYSSYKDYDSDEFLIDPILMEGYESSFVDNRFSVKVHSFIAELKTSLGFNKKFNI
jgi:hypothetical protein